MDFVLLSNKYHIVCVIECDGLFHKNKYQRDKDIKRDELLDKWGIPIVRIKPCSNDGNAKEQSKALRMEVLRQLEKEYPELTRFFK